MGRNDRSIEDRIMARDFGDREVVEALDAMSIEAVCRALYSPADDGQPFTERTFAEGQGSWHVGDGRPGLADDDPAVMQALGRCAAYQVRRKLPGLMPLVAKAHPGECAWCGYPVAEMIRACDWAVVTSRYLATERLSWLQWPLAKPGDRGVSYSRSGQSGVYVNGAHAAFWELCPDVREARIQAAQYPPVT